MGMKLPFLPTCGGPSKTLSFRDITTEFDDMFATGDMEKSVESAIRGLRTERFFFNPGKTSSILEDAKPNKIDKGKEKGSVVPFKDSVSMMEMQSTDPFADFKKSMQEMLEADKGLKEWENLQDLLSLYLTVNDKISHGYIIGAFVDLFLVNLCSPLSSSSSVIGQEKSLFMESGSNSCSNNSHKSTESALSLTSSSASSSEVCSSTCSHCLSSSSLEDR
ncbi:putative transcription factor OFP family [Helianthus debilis subsp. tardiflorus]